MAAISHERAFGEDFAIAVAELLSRCVNPTFADGAQCQKVLAAVERSSKSKK